MRVRNQSSGATHIVVDLIGYYDTGSVDGLRLTAISPRRVFDTWQPGVDNPAPLGSNETRPSPLAPLVETRRSWPTSRRSNPPWTPTSRPGVQVKDRLDLESASSTQGGETPQVQPWPPGFRLLVTPPSATAGSRSTTTAEGRTSSSTPRATSPPLRGEGHSPAQNRGNPQYRCSTRAVPGPTHSPPSGIAGGDLAGRPAVGTREQGPHSSVDRRRCDASMARACRCPDAPPRPVVAR